MFERTPPFMIDVQTFTAVETAAGKTIRPRLGDVPNQQGGREVHLARLEITGTLDYDGDATAMPAAMGEWLVPSCMRDFRLKVGKHLYFQGLPGRALVHDALRRIGLEQSYSAIADSTVSGATQAFRLIIPFDLPQAGEDRRYDDVFPMQALDHERSVETPFEFTVANTFEGFPGVTINNLGSLTVRAHCVLGESLNQPTPYVLRQEVITETVFKLHTEGSLEYVTLFDAQTDTTVWDRDHSRYSNIELTWDDQVMYSGKSSEFLESQYNGMTAGQIGVGGGSFLTTGAPEFLPITAPTPLGGYKTRRPRGKMKMSYSRSGLAETTILYRDGGQHTDAKDAEYSLAVGAPRDPSSPGRVIATGQWVNKNAAGILPRKIFHPNIASRVARSKVFDQ